MKAKVKSLDEYARRSGDNDCAWLLEQVRAVTLQFNAKRNSCLLLMDARTSFLTCKQGQHQSRHEYLAVISVKCGVLPSALTAFLLLI